MLALQSPGPVAVSATARLSLPRSEAGSEPRYRSAYPRPLIHERVATGMALFGRKGGFAFSSSEIMLFRDFPCIPYRIIRYYYYYIWLVEGRVMGVIGTDDLLLASPSVLTELLATTSLERRGRGRPRKLAAKACAEPTAVAPGMAASHSDGKPRGVRRLPVPPPMSLAERRQMRAALDLAQGAKREWRRCTCGQCPRCMENARWERIFLERFADPDYYTCITVRRRSPLAGM